MDEQEYAAALKSIVRSENSSDVVLVAGIGGEHYNAHRVILAARAPVRSRPCSPPSSP